MPVVTGKIIRKRWDAARMSAVIPGKRHNVLSETTTSNRDGNLRQIKRNHTSRIFIALGK